MNKILPISSIATAMLLLIPRFSEFHKRHLNSFPAPEDIVQAGKAEPGRSLAQPADNGWAAYISSRAVSPQNMTAASL